MCKRQKEHIVREETYKKVCNPRNKNLELLYIFIKKPYGIFRVQDCLGPLEIAEESMLSDTQCILSLNEKNTPTFSSRSLSDH